MVGLVVVSHSEALASGVVALAREMAGPELAIEPAGGIGDSDPAHPVLGTDAERVREAIQRASSPDGVLVLIDLGSALMSAELAVELLDGAAGEVRLSAAPLVEGAVAAAVAAAGGATLDEVEAQAIGALAVKAGPLLADDASPGPPETDGPAAGASEASGLAPGAPAARAPVARVPEAGGPMAEGRLPVRSAIGLHARPAARIVAAARALDADVRIGVLGGRPPVSAGSLTELLALGARFGDTLVVEASGPQAAEAVRALEELAVDGFGDGAAAQPEPEPGSEPESAPSPAGPAAAAAAASPAAAAPPAPAGEAPPVAATPPAPAPAPPLPGAVLAGVPAGGGVAAGPARSLASAPAPDERPAQGAAGERAALDAGIAGARAALQRDRATLAARAGESEAEIFDAHVALLDDDALLGPARAAIDAGATAERAWHDAAERAAARYRALPEPLLRERAADVIDVGRRVVSAITGVESGTDAGEGIAIADELTPAQAVALDPERVLAVATARGSATAHAAIVVRALGLPIVVGLGERLLAVPDGAPLLLDGDAGTVVVEPPAGAVADARRRRAERRRRLDAARARAREPAVTRDGTAIEVCANLGAAGEAAPAVELGADGVGLLRTEFLFAGRGELPSEDEQVAVLEEIATALGGRHLVVRTLDAGADKPLPALATRVEDNPFLGVRGVRLALAHPDVLDAQLRAILRVAAEGFPVRAMVPMVSVLSELLAVRAALHRARAHTGVDAPLPLGIMVEVPAAALTAPQLALQADFFSIGTNDLTQYTMAADRGDARLAALLAGLQPAVLALVRATVDGAAPAARPVAVCGELAGDTAGAVLLAGLGVTELSVAPPLVAEVKQALRSISIADARAAALSAIESADADAARAIVQELLQASRAPRS